MGTTAGESAKTIPTSMPVAVAKGASHCGAGCVLGDIIAEGLASGHPSVLSTLGLTAIFPERLFAQWALDYLAALFAGVAFQYFTLKRMRNLSIKDGLLEAFKADVASITCWQAGMYGFLAIAQFLWFRPLYGGLAQADSPEFWFVMQLAMICGFATAYPMNWLLVRTGVKERM
jgi:hypothetical protein